MCLFTACGRIARVRAKLSFFQSKELMRMSIDRFIWTKLSRVDNEKTKKNLAKLLAIRIRKAEKAERLTS